jgi:DNA-binding MltR family transcriptional regulator
MGSVPVNDPALPSDDVVTPSPLRFPVAFMDAVSAPTDRGCAQLVVAVIDAQLDALMRTRGRRHDTDLTDSLLGPSGALAGASVRVDLAFFLGWISADLRNDINVLREAAAMLVEDGRASAGFESPDVRAALEGLALDVSRHRLAETVSKTIGSDRFNEVRRQRTDSVARTRFVLVGAVISLLLIAATRLPVVGSGGLAVL